MPAAPQNPELQQLTKTVAALTEALARSERRHAHIARSLRWGGLILVTLMAGVGALVAERTGIAVAQTGGIPEATTVVEALNRIDQKLALFGMMGETMQQLTPAITSAMGGNPEVREAVDDYLRAQKLPLTDDNRRAYTAPVIVNSAVTTMVDMVVLMQRIREDSNAFRDFVGGPIPALRGLEHELHLMNGALASVPAMAVQMDFMNRNMASMTNSIGSTMGRMGTWLP